MKEFKKGTLWFMLQQTALAGFIMFCFGQIWGADGAIITGVLLSIAMLSSMRYNQPIDKD